MEILDPVHGSIELSNAETAILDSPAFQRLRSIKQLGFGEYSFPGATHNRFIHSLGASHLARSAFDKIFENYEFKNKKDKQRLRQTVMLAALLHDVGHGPLSHASEEVMPAFRDLKIKALERIADPDRRANHEDFTIKFITDSPLSKTLKENFSDIHPLHIACVIDPKIKSPDDFFDIDGIDVRPLLSQIISSELDVDRMDYLSRDSHFCGISYGKIEYKWLIENFMYHEVDGRLHLAINRRALYTFDDFLISRHHMYLMVYFHHKAIIYDEMLQRYLTSDDCDYKIPADINEYTHFTDYHFYEHIVRANNPWARRIARRAPLKMIYELHETHENKRTGEIRKQLEENDIEFIHSSSKARLSKYHPSLPIEEKGRQIYVVDKYNPSEKPYPIEETTNIFQQYEKTRRIDRIYVDPEKSDKVLKLIRR